MRARGLGARVRTLIRPVRASALACVSASLVAACGGGALRTPAFSSNWQSDNGKSIAAVERRVGAIHVPESRGLAIGVTRTALLAIGLDGSHRWTHAAVVDSRPAIAGGVVVYTEGGALVALDASSGAQLWRIPVGNKRLRGAGDDGTTTVASLGSDAGGSSALIAVGRSGAVIHEWTPEVEVGTPATVGGVVFAPWGGQYVSALDTSGGAEAGRLLTRVVASRAIAIGGSLYFGEEALVRLDAAIVDSSKGGAHTVKLPERKLPGKPVWFRSGAQVLPPAAGAPDSIRFYARPTEVAGKLGVDSDRFAATYFRIVVGFNAEDGALRWVKTFPTEIIGGDAASNGFALCDTAGNVTLVEARAGGDAGHVSFGQPVEGCAVNGGSFRVPEGKDSGSLTEQITAAIELPETQMATIQRFLLRELGTNQDPAVTKTLLDLASNGRMQPDIVEEARNQLASRRNGLDDMLEALGHHYDYLSDKLRPPPVGPLADALATAKEPRAAPLLAAHLNDPSDSSNDVRRASHALVTLATPEELPAIETFFGMYRATADNDDLIAAVVDAARVLVKLDGADGTAIVQRAAQDPLTNSGVREGLGGLVSATPGG